jgi:hypothetical protein
MIYTWEIAIDYQYSCKIVAKDYHNGNTYKVWSLNEIIYAKASFKFDEVIMS